MSKGRGGKAGRLGDETRARIDDLQGGWKLPGAPAAEDDDVDATPEHPPAAESVRKSRPTKPPPPPRAKKRTMPPAPPPRAKKPTMPPAPPPRAKKPTVPPGPPPGQKQGPTRPPPAADSGPVALADADKLPSLPAPRKKEPSVPPIAPSVASGSVPTRSKQPTRPPPIKKAEPAPSLPPAVTVSPIGADDNDPTRLTTYDAPDGVTAGPSYVASGLATGTVRLPDSLPRKSGVLGDVAYLFRVLAKRRAARRELAKIAETIASEKEARNTKLLEMARHAIGDESYDQSLVGRARASLLSIEEKRSHHAGRVAAAEEKVATLEKHRRDEQARRKDEREKLTMEIEAITTSLEPLTERTAEARRQAAKLRRQLKLLDEKLRKKEASLVSVDEPANKAAVHAEIASLTAERDAVEAEEPAIAAEIDDLEPKIASLLSTRGELEDKLQALKKEDELEEVRLHEKVVAVQAGQVVEKRAVSDQSVRRQDALLNLGEALHNEPPDANNPRLKAVERHDLEIGTMERRSLELKELIDSVEVGPMFRGGLWLFLLLGSVAGALTFAALR